MVKVGALLELTDMLRMKVDQYALSVRGTPNPGVEPIRTSALTPGVRLVGTFSGGIIDATRDIQENVRETFFCHPRHRIQSEAR